jgi:hypothetical protein
MELDETTIERARAILRLQQRVLEHRVEGLTAAQSAERLGVSDSVIEELRRFLRLTTGKAWRGGVKPSGRTRNLVLTVEVRR